MDELAEKLILREGIKKENTAGLRGIIRKYNYVDIIIGINKVREKELNN